MEVTIKLQTDLVALLIKECRAYAPKSILGIDFETLTPLYSAVSSYVQPQENKEDPAAPASVPTAMPDLSSGDFQSQVTQLISSVFQQLAEHANRQPVD